MSTRRSLSLTYLAQVISFLLTFSSSIYLARVLSPRDFGIFGMATAVTTVISVFMTLGLARYIVREKSVDDDMLSTLFTVNVIIAVCYISSILLGSFISGYFFEAAELSQFLLVFAIFPLFSMMEFIPSALCNRDMRFGLIAVLTVLRAAVLAGVTIALAIYGFAYMSFAWAQVCAWLLTSVAYNMVVWRPRVWRFSLKNAREVLRFGWQMVGVSGLNQLGSRVGEIIMGASLGYASLGLYSRAANIPANIYNNVFSTGTNVIFSKLALELRENGVFHDLYYRFSRMLLGLIWPMFLGVAVLASPLVNILYGERWQAAAVPLTLLSLAFATSATVGLSAEVFILRHQTHLQVRNEALRTSFGLTLFGVATLISLPFAAAAKLLEATFAVMLYFAPLRRLVGGSKLDNRRLYVEAFVLSVVAVLPSLLLMFWTGFSPQTKPPLIIASVLTGILLWGTLLFISQHPLASELLRLWRRKP
jgi:O-antigen/teichoic acid export membrane protein